ncbi:peptidase propeptide and YpeB domain protein [Streptomyces sp. AJS327]|uniref:PepSY domain-containing protein n=1 Tax=Streptomyces sp. AJS327 TaxID=2545265 RepID=UPI0015DE5B6A|nr:PepSY domain-containing protein [Streptomyces sp. AJS327]MBA0051622.1 peptidase propeptide and YpeB domain protein [Streptomyces sp. AJS327]
MKRKIVIATVAAGALIAGGTATAVAAVGSDGGGSGSSAPVVTEDGKDDDRDDDRDDRDDRDDDRDDRDGDDRDDRDDRDDASAARGKGVISAGEAASAALEKVPGHVTELDLDDDGGDGDGGRNGLVWEADVLSTKGTWYEITLDARSGKVLAEKRDDDGDDDVRPSTVRGLAISASQAAERAASGGAVVTSVDLDTDDGALTWEVETAGKDGAERELTVDARSGQVQQDTDRDDDQDDDDRDDRDDDADDRDDDRDDQDDDRDD